MSESEIPLKFATATIENFNLILTRNNISIKFDLDTLSKIFDKLINIIGVVIDKKASNYDKTKKYFGKFLNYNYMLIKNHLDVDSLIIELFKEGPNNNWHLLHVSMVSYLSYLSYLQQIEKSDVENKINYKGMIDKLMIEIEEFTDSDTETNATTTLNPLEKFDPKSMLDEISKQIPKTDATPKLMKGLLGDIKEILTNNNDLKNTSIIDISRNLSDKYQTMIEKGDVNISDLLSGVFGILNDPDSLNGEFDDINPDNLPDPNTILSDMANDPKLKEAMGMMGGNIDGGGGGMNGMFSSMMSNMMNKNKDNSVDNKSISELEKEIEQMMREVQEAEAAKETNTRLDRLLDLEIQKLD